MRPFPRAPRRLRIQSFVLLEVIVSLAILGIAVAAFMRSFTVSLKMARDMEIQTQAIFFADQLMDYFEIMPPGEGTHVGGFGDAYKNYSYRVEVRLARPRYSGFHVPDTIDRIFQRRDYTLQIIYTSARLDHPYTALKLNSSIIGFEKFSTQSKQSYANF